MKKESFHVVLKFNVERSQFGNLTKLVKEFFQKDVERAEGFISAKFHANEEQTVFLNYATWKSKEAYELFVSTVGKKSETALKIKQFNPESNQVYHIKEI